MKILSFLLKCACLYSLVSASTAFAQSKISKETIGECSQKMQTITVEDADVRRVRKVFNKHTHYRGTAHIIVPHPDMNYNDSLLAYNELNESDIPVILFLFKNEEKLFKVGNMVINHFGTKALPCLIAAKKLYPEGRRFSDLYNAVTFHIESTK